MRIKGTWQLCHGMAFLLYATCNLSISCLESAAVMRVILYYHVTFICDSVLSMMLDMNNLTLEHLVFLYSSYVKLRSVRENSVGAFLRVQVHHKDSIHIVSNKVKSTGILKDKKVKHYCQVLMKVCM
jgi:hypothetical protein